MDVAELLARRHCVKAFDAERKIPEETMAKLSEALRLSASSVNTQPWHVVVAAGAAGKERMARAASGPYAYNAPKILAASHVVALCARRDLDSAALEAVLAQEGRDGRFPRPGDAERQRASRESYVALHRDELQDLPHWMDKQVYLQLGTLLLAAAALEVDACPMEGFAPDVLSRELGLEAKGLRPVVLVALGYRSAEDWNAALPKSRLPAEAVFTFLD